MPATEPGGIDTGGVEPDVEGAGPEVVAPGAVVEEVGLAAHPVKTNVSISNVETAVKNLFICNSIELITAQQTTGPVSRPLFSC